MAKEYFIVINGEKVPVSEAEYRAFKRPLWSERKRREIRATKEQSLDELKEKGFDVADEQALVEKIVEDNMLLETLMSALNELTDDERSLIKAIYYDEKSEREVASEIGVSSVMVHKRKHKILKKLRDILKN